MSQIPRNFKWMTSRSQKLFRKLLDPDPDKRLNLAELPKYVEDRWLRKGSVKPGSDVRGVGDGLSQLTLGSFQVRKGQGQGCQGCAMIGNRK